MVLIHRGTARLSFQPFKKFGAGIKATESVPHIKHVPRPLFRDHPSRTKGRKNANLYSFPWQGRNIVFDFSKLFKYFYIRLIFKIVSIYLFFLNDCFIITFLILIIITSRYTYFRSEIRIRLKVNPRLKLKFTDDDFQIKSSSTGIKDGLKIIRSIRSCLHLSSVLTNVQKQWRND